MGRKIKDVKLAKDGTIDKVLLSGNTNYLSSNRVVKLADEGKIEGAHSVHAKDKKPHLRSNPDDSKRNNLK